MTTTDREGGFIKTHRRWESSPVIQALTAEGETVWHRLLFAANWKPTEVLLRTGPRTIQRGQALISELALARRARVGRQVVRTALQALILHGAITCESVQPLGNPRARLITIVNYDEYQADDRDVTIGVTSAQPTGNQWVTRSEEVEEVEEEDHGGSGMLFDEQPSPPPTPFSSWLVETYRDIRDPVTFERAMRSAFPALDLLAAAKRARAWEVANPGKAKKAHRRFLHNWFTNESSPPAWRRERDAPTERPARREFTGLDPDGRPIYEDGR